jgi:hypothetical protein
MKNLKIVKNSTTIKAREKTSTDFGIPRVLETKFIKKSNFS